MEAPVFWAARADFCKARPCWAWKDVEATPHASHNPVTKASAPEEIALFGGAKSGLQAIVPPEVAAPGKEHVWRQRHHHMFWDCDVVKAGHLGPICPHVAKKVAPGPQSSNKMQ